MRVSSSYRTIAKSKEARFTSSDLQAREKINTNLFLREDRERKVFCLFCGYCTYTFNYKKCNQLVRVRIFTLSIDWNFEMETKCRGKSKDS